MDSCRYIKPLLALYLEGIFLGGLVDLSNKTPQRAFHLQSKLLKGFILGIIEGTPIGDKGDIRSLDPEP